MSQIEHPETIDRVEVDHAQHFLGEIVRNTAMMAIISESEAYRSTRLSQSTANSFLD
jgi:hypothetical protein